MTITLNFEFGNREAKNFNEIVSELFEQVMELGRLTLVSILQSWDEELLNQRDKQRYRNKGMRETSFKTRFGVVSFSRRVYIDMAAEGGIHCVYLLDEALQIEKEGLITSDICELASELICKISYRDTANTIGDVTGLTISHKGVWNLIQGLAEHQQALVERYAELHTMGAGIGTIASEVLYEEKDGVWLKMQGKDRIQYGADKEMKVGIQYDGALWTSGAHGSQRRSLDNKVAYATFASLPEFQKGLDAVASSKFDLEKVTLTVTNGDGANWIQGSNSEQHLYTLDTYHRNRKIPRCVKDPALARELLQRLYANDIPGVLQRIEEALSQAEDGKERENLQVLLSYYQENQTALLGYRDRGIAIPDTREPGLVHHARLGSMESNIYTIIGNRMKGGRACWSIQGGNHLALLLCLYHTDGFGSLFPSLPPIPERTSESEPIPERIPEPVDNGPPPCSASKVPVTEGKGLECYCSATLPNIPWLKSMTAYRSLSEL